MTGRIEDARLLRGAGRYTADRIPSGCLHAVFARSPYAHARIGRIDTARARAIPGVAGVFVGTDIGAAPGVGNPSPLIRADGSPAPVTPRTILAMGTVRHAGEPVALVVARDPAAASDAIDALDIDYAEMPALATIAAALAPGAAPLWDEAPDNIAYRWRHGAHDDVAKALATAAHVVRLRAPVSRVSAAPLEPRAILAEFRDGRFEVLAATQTPFALRDGLAKALGVEPARVHVLAEDVGGAFGLKADVCREDAAVCWAARALGAPVRWISDRTEALVADDHGRDVEIDVALALDAEGKFLALDVRYAVNVGAYVSTRSGGPITNIGGIAGVYATKAIAADIKGVFTHTVPTAPYRGAGRPDATYAIERAIDVAATKLGVDPLDLRRRNLVPVSAMPYRTPFLFEYDCGDFPANVDAAEKLAGLAGFQARRAEAATRGKLRGLGVCNPIEVAGGPYGKVGPDVARLDVTADGTFAVRTGAMSVGQGLETAWSDMIAARLGVDAGVVAYRQGDTDLLATGRGSGGSAGLCVSGAAVALAADAAIEKGRERAAEILEAAMADIEFAAGDFRVVGTDKRASWAEIAGAAGLTVEAKFQPPRVTFPNGCHICEVEVDPETGKVDVIAYSAVEDIGRVLNAQLAHGQIHGGIAQGLGQALLESVVHDPATGQVLTGSFMDYAMPRADDMPALAVHLREVPTDANALGAKGVGEAGTVGALSAVVNAVCDALRPLGVVHIDMPLTPHRVWAAIRAAR